MTADLGVSEVRLTPAPAAQASTGLVGFASFVVMDLVRLDSIAVRRTRDGRVVLAFPVKHDRAGRQHPLVRPVNDTARQAITRAVIEALQLRLERGP